MDALDALTKKVQLVASELVALKKEKQQLLGRIDQLQAELGQTQKTLRESESFRRQQEKIRTRLEKLSRKIEKHLVSEQAMLIAAEGGH